MSGGEAFDILTAADIASRERRARRSRSTRSEWSPFFGSIYKIHTPVASTVPVGAEVSRSIKLMTRSWIEILVAIAAAIIVMLMVASGGLAADRAARAEASDADLTIGEPDPLTLCMEVNGRVICGAARANIVHASNKPCVPRSDTALRRPEFGESGRAGSGT
jgi:hypothetical protein